MDMTALGALALTHPTQIIFGFTVVIGLLIALFVMHSSHKSGKIDWSDLLTYPGMNKVSLTKLLQLTGGITATWIMVKLTLTDKLTFDIFGLYLLYVGSIETFSKYFRAKFGSANAAADVKTDNKDDVNG